MYDIRIDVEKNRLYLTLTGTVTLDDVTPILDDFTRLAVNLKPGYGIIDDLSELEALEKKIEEVMVPIMKFVKESYAGGVIRVVPESLSGEAKARLFEEKSEEAGYTAAVVHTLEEAEKILDEIQT